jgi:hypothetical protein
MLSAGDEEFHMEQEPVRDDRLDIAHRMYHALCTQYPDRFVTLFDQNGTCVSAHSPRPEVPAVEATISPAPI